MTDNKVQSPGQTARWWSTREAAVFLGVHVQTVRNMIRDGNLPAYKFGRGTVRIREEDLTLFAPRLIEPTDDPHRQ